MIYRDVFNSWQYLACVLEVFRCHWINQYYDFESIMAKFSKAFILELVPEKNSYKQFPELGSFQFFHPTPRVVFQQVSFDFGPWSRQGSSRTPLPGVEKLWDPGTNMKQLQGQIIYIYTGWWLSNPYEKYESQWEGWHPIYEMENKKCLKPPTSIYIYICVCAFIYIPVSVPCRSYRQKRSA